MLKKLFRVGWSKKPVTKIVNVKLYSKVIFREWEGKASYMRGEFAECDNTDIL